MKNASLAIVAALFCGCAAQSAATAVEEPREDLNHWARRQAALRRLGETNEGVRQAGATTVVVACWECISESICDEFSLMRAEALLNEHCPSGKGHATASAIGTAQTARACTAKCYKYEMPTGSYQCD